MSFDENSDTSGQITNFVSKMPSSKAELNNLLKEGRFIKEKPYENQIITISYFGVDEEYKKESFGKIVQKQVEVNSKEIYVIYYKYSEYDGNLYRTRVDSLERYHTESYYYSNGNLKSVRQTNRRLRYGEQKEFYESGQLQKSTNFENGKRLGDTKIYYESGQLKEHKYFHLRNSRMIINHKKYYENGQLKVEGKWRKPVGDEYSSTNLFDSEISDWTYYDKKGNITEQYNKDGYPEFLYFYEIGTATNLQMIYICEVKSRNNENYDTIVKAYFENHPVNFKDTNDIKMFYWENSKLNTPSVIQFGKTPLLVLQAFGTQVFWEKLGEIINNQIITSTVSKDETLEPINTFLRSIFKTLDIEESLAEYLNNISLFYDKIIK